MHFVNSGGGRFALVVTDQDRGGLLRLNQSYGASTLDSLTDRGYTLVADFSTDLDYRNQHDGDTRHGWQVTLTDAGAAVRTPANTAVNTGG